VPGLNQCEVFHCDGFFAFRPRGSPRWGTVTASTGGLDDEDVAGPKFGAVGASHHMAAAVGALDPLPAEGSIQPSGEPERSYVAAG
jgi:hypothetical protein